MGRKHTTSKPGKVLLNAFQERSAELASQGLPSFCQPRHYVASSKMHSVPVWELPADTQWIIDGLASQSSSGDPSKNPTELWDESQTADDASEICDSESDIFSSEQESAVEDGCDSESGDAAAFLNVQGTWSRASVRRFPLLFRCVQDSASSTDTGCYFVGISTALLPLQKGCLSQQADPALDNHLLKNLGMQRPRWAVLALSSCGHFAGAIFDGPAAIVHKTLHRYTSRAKQGGSQAAFDARGKNASSAGSNMRRYGQQRLGEDIHALLTKDWASELARCDRIFISVPPKLRCVLVGERRQPYIPCEKIHKLPFAVPKPTFEAVRRAYTQVSQVFFFNKSTLESLVAQASQSTKARHPARKCDVEGDPHITALHSAALDGDEERIFQLLEAGADPTAQDSRGRVPYELCLSRGARRAFFEWRDHREETWQWSHVGSPVDSAKEVEQRTRKDEKNKKGQHADRLTSAASKARQNVGHEDIGSASCTGSKGAGKNSDKGGPLTLAFNSKQSRRSSVAWLAPAPTAVRSQRTAAAAAQHAAPPLPRRQAAVGGGRRR